MNLYKYVLALGLASVLALPSCKGSEDVPNTTYIGADQISRIELSPNSSVLNADGQSRLDFKVNCYYQVEGKEYRLLEDRVPRAEIRIIPSEGEAFTLDKGYTTESTNSSVSFQASLGNLTSSSVSVSLRANLSESLTPLRIPISVSALYTETTKPQTTNLSRAYLESAIKRANDVFAGRLYPAPNGCDAKIEFYLKDLNLVALTKEQGEDMLKYIQENELEGADKAIRLWVLPSFPTRGLWPRDIAPAYTTGETSALPGLRLKKVESASAIDKKKLQPKEVGFALSYNALYSNTLGQTEYRLENLLGRFFGLLPTERSSRATVADVDYCPDTFSYPTEYNQITKRSVATDALPSVSYDSYNIMDVPSSCSSLSRDQVLRIRQVIKDCPYRQQGQ